jgi:uncharacterized iron-regulated protein
MLVRPRTLRAAGLLVLVAGCAGPVTVPSAPTPPVAEDVRIYRGDGTPARWGELREAAASARVILLGEAHQDTVGHRLRHRLVGDLLDARASSEAPPPLLLSLEMFEWDVQLVLDEYLAGLITEEHFLGAARPWANYERDYRPYVELAREHDIPVVAANPPRRYVNRVARLGPEALEDLPGEAFRWLPPLPVAEASEAYREEWQRSMGGDEGHGHGGESLLMAQTLWDAGMAYAIHRAMERHPLARVVHVAGSFHVAGGTGIPEHLARYRPGVETLIVVAYPTADGVSFDPEAHGGRGDFVLLTRRP